MRIHSVRCFPAAIGKHMDYPEFVEKMTAIAEKHGILIHHREAKTIGPAYDRNKHTTSAQFELEGPPWALALFFQDIASEMYHLAFNTPIRELVADAEVLNIMNKMEVVTLGDFSKKSSDEVIRAAGSREMGLSLLNFLYQQGFGTSDKTRIELMDFVNAEFAKYRQERNPIRRLLFEVIGGEPEEESPNEESFPFGSRVRN